MLDMKMTRRSFMGLILATGIAPAFVRAESLMKIVVPNVGIILPDNKLVIPQLSKASRIFTALAMSQSAYDAEQSGLIPIGTFNENGQKVVKFILERPMDYKAYWNRNG